MKEQLKPYAEVAKYALIIVGGGLAAFGFASTATAHLIVGAALAFGMAFWKLYGILTGKKDGKVLETLTLAQAAISTILLGLGIADANTIAIVAGGVGSAAATFWAFVQSYKNK